MKREHPILFSASMVQAILEGRKSMTRRIVKPQPDEKSNIFDFQPLSWPKKPWTAKYELNDPIPHYEITDSYKCPYGIVGDMLWVRETFLYRSKHDKYYFKADHSEPYSEPYAHSGWKPSIYMPKAASRIWLGIVNIRVERLMDISADDAGDEGVEYWNVDLDAFEGGELVADYKNYMWRDDETYEDYHFPTYANPVSSFFSLWESINGKESLEANPWVWVIEFKVLSTTGRPLFKKLSDIETV